MSGVVLLRDFEPDIPNDLRVTFIDKLPEEALCIQCDNVSARLYRDVRGHGYCTSCRAMCERDGAFECATCQKKYKTWQLMRDFSASEKIKTARVICPKTSRNEPVFITFSALKAHLQRCSCNDVAKEAAGSNAQSSGSMLSLPLPTKQQSAAYFADKQEGTIGVKMCVCTLCNNSMPRKLIRDHMKECLGKQLDSLQYEESFPEVGTAHAANKFTGDHTSLFNSGACPSRKEPPMSSTDSSEISELARQLKEALSEISCLKHEVAELKKVANEGKGDIDLLQVAVPTMQGDMRNVQIQCEQRIEKSEKTVSSLEESHSSIEKMLSVIDEETKARLDAVEEAMKDMNEKFSTAVHSLQERSQYLHEAIMPLYAQLNQIRNDFLHFVHNFVPEQEPSQGKKGHGRSK
ncbi:uncharacterized protein LOC119464228 isoform X2 [Dermacentor silvarum]|uniref:uncharacterized protein LOC119464228 isoform X2 n=1 Tax=Dermacentor silvarum TaxID=543639 RepID=UPI002101BA2C|nr:uncharacterized protein LOC119464228 isoform X2 [Dermacentor silvarum]